MGEFGQYKKNVDILNKVEQIHAPSIILPPYHSTVVLWFVDNISGSATRHLDLLV